MVEEIGQLNVAVVQISTASSTKIMRFAQQIVGENNLFVVRLFEAVGGLD